ncbi:MAG: nuclear transport factor 2 family protein [Candidatus Eisenbacteria bacterium]
MTQSEFITLLHGLAAAWSRRDYAAAAGVFAEDVRYADPTRYAWEGRAALRAFFEADEGFEQETVLHTILFDEQRQVGAAEYTYRGTHTYHGVALIRLEAGKIAQWREYQHIDPRPWIEFVGKTAF